MVDCGPNGAAARLGMNRSTVQFRMKKLGIAKPGRSRSKAFSKSSRVFTAAPLGKKQCLESRCSTGWNRSH